VTISENSSIQDAAKKMAEKHVGSLIVLENKTESKKPVGIITDRDITVKITAKKANLADSTVADVMSKDLFMLPSDLGIKKSIDAMRDKGVRRAIIMDNDQIHGVVAVDDLMIMLASELKGLADLIEHQIGGH
jgi:predicted transcriptional regulator